MRRATDQSGYIGLLGLLIGVSILIFVMVKVYLTPSKSASEFQPANADGTIPSTEVERRRATIDKVNAIANQQKEKAAEIDRMMNAPQ